MITGEWREVGIGFKSEGAFIYNIVTGKKDIVPGVPYPIDLYWDNNSDNLYLKDYHRPDRKHIYNYKLSTKETEVTDYFDFYFSPNGEYYFRPKDRGFGIERFQVFNTETNQPISLTLPKNIGKSIGWAFDRGS